MNQLANRFLFGISVLIIAFTAWFFSDIVAYILISMVTWFILTPLVNLLDHSSIKGYSLPRWLATLVSQVLFLLLIGILFYLFVPAAFEQAASLSSLDIDLILLSLEEPLGKLEAVLQRYEISSNPKEEIQTYFKNEVFYFFRQLGDLISYMVGLTGDLLVGIFAVGFISFFFLKDEDLVKRIILGLTPDEHDQRVRRVMSNAKRLLSRYFIGLMIQVSLISTLVTIGLTIMGVENALFIGIFAGLINVIPYLGPVIGTAFGMFFIFTLQVESGLVPGYDWHLLQCLLIFAVVQLLDNIVFQPLIFSNSVYAHPLEIFLIIFIAGKLAGIIGMIVAIPSYTLFRIIGKEFLTQFKIVKNLTKNI